jgi:hypothetical protein
MMDTIIRSGASTWFRDYPILLFILGIAIHVRSVVLILLGQEEASVWAWWVHSSMLIFNTLMLIGLIFRRRSAYLISACGLAALIVFQGMNAIITNQISILTICGWILCLLAVPMLIHSYRK